MRNFKSTTNHNFAGMICSLLLLTFLFSCETEQIAEEEMVLDARVNAEFPTYHQGFNHDLHPWADSSIEGFWGWCGSIELQTRKSSDLAPSAGQGFATVMNGTCNEYWSAEFESSAPATFDEDLWSSSWPSSGFIHELDIYLDPAMYDEGAAFTYTNSLYYPALAYPFIYFVVDVVKTGEVLTVDGYPVEEAGWYTFRMVNDSDSMGMLSVDFELLDKGRLLYTASIDQTMYGEETSDFEAAKLGSGYIWFVSIAEGVELPIDEYRLRPGK
ncbi:hypothetical protein [Salinimicrobium flavum]|uniref:Uncharacterized protein n=1 Tax=Salinimicrobium flavum TaxID=1737065 RepID=A0ABW5IXZ1_9FLAO